MRLGEQTENCQVTSNVVSEEKAIFKELTRDKYEERWNPWRKMP